MTDSDPLFFKNIELWAKTDPKQALLLPNRNCSDLQFVKTEVGELNLKRKINGKWQFYHSQKGAQKEAFDWFKSLNLGKSQVLFVYGIGLGYYFDAAQDWLKKNKERRLVFLEDDLDVIHRFLETERGTQLLQNSQAQLVYFKDLSEEEAVFEILYWNFAMKYITTSALKSYEKAKPTFYQEFCQKIAFDSAVKNALVDEYLRYGGSFYINFYQNMLSLPGSYLGNKTFGSFRKIPAIICGAGPSLEKNLAALSKVLDKALVFTGGSSLNALNAFGIQPHLGAGIDPNPAQYTRLSSNEAYEVPFYYRNRMYHEAFEEIHGPRLYITGCGGYDVAEYFEEKLKIKQEFLDEGHNVINFCLQIAQQLGCDPIIFIGLDLAFTGMKSYAPGIEENNEFDPTKFGEVDEFDERPLLLKDIYGKPLYTLWKWMAESEWISKFAKEHSETTILNATEGGLGFKDVPNVPFKEVIKQYLTRDYAIKDRLHGVIETSAIPHVTLKKVTAAMIELKESLLRCIEHLTIMIEETELSKKQSKAGHALSGRAALSEVELSEEVGFQYILEIFNEVQVRLFNRILHEIKEWSEKKRNAEKSKINLQRLKFLREGAKINVGMIDLALEKRKEKPTKSKGKKETPDLTPPEYPIKDFHPTLIPKKPTEGIDAGNRHLVTMQKQYGKPPEEIRLNHNGLWDGQALSYYPDGTLKAEVFYKKGSLHGPSSFFSEDGKLLSKSWFVNGKQQGESKWFYATGALYAIQRYKNGSWHGLQEYYYPNGQRKTLLTYKNGKLIDSQVF